MSAKDFSDVTRRLQEEVDRRQLPIRKDARDPSHLIGSLRSQIEAIERGDFDAVLSHAHDNVTLDIFAPAEFRWICQTRGVAELRRALEHNFASVEGQSPTVSQICMDGDTVVLFGHEAGRIRATGVPYTVEFVERFTFRDDRLAAIRIIVADASQRAGFDR